MRRDGKKEKILYITAAVLFVVLAAALMALLLQGNWTKEPEEEVTSPTALPTQAPLEGGITIGSKTVDPGVESFDLSGRTLTDADREAIASLSQLTTLSLTNCGITDVSFLSSLTRLRTLYLSGNRITDLTPLTSLTALRTLYLDNNPLTDLTPLTRLTALTTLSMQGVSVADYVLEDLQAAMPQCRIFNDSTVEGARPISLGGVAFTEDVELLDLSNRGISDISKLSYCLKLQELNLVRQPPGEPGHSPGPAAAERAVSFQHRPGGRGSGFPLLLPAPDLPGSDGKPVPYGGRAGAAEDRPAVL